MDSLTITITGDDLTALQNVAQQGKTGSQSANLQETAKSLLSEAIDNAKATPAPPHETEGHGSYTLAAHPAIAKTLQWVLSVAFLIALVGGYILRWAWTGFPANNQLWDWLSLLLLPLAFATLPLWLKHSRYMSTRRQIAYLSALVVAGGFVLVSYLAPFDWTGFQGNTLWDWLNLILLPATLVTIRTWPATGRPVGPIHKLILALLTASWLVTVLGGYVANWTWTGYQGNTLWDWLQMLLLPIIFPTILLPAAVVYVSGDVEHKAAELEAKQTAAQSSGLRVN